LAQFRGLFDIIHKTILFCDSLMKRISTDALFKLIAVRPPYFALSGIRIEGKWVLARVPVQYPLLGEVGPISIAEASRHTSILGSAAIALALQTKGLEIKRYYLASQSKIMRLSDSPPPKKPNLVAKARLHAISRRMATVHAALFDLNEGPLFDLKISYLMLRRRIFESLFCKNKPACIDGYRANQQGILPLFSSLQLGLQEATAKLGPIEHTWCQGHFPGCPKLPVAIVMKNLAHLSGLLMMQSKTTIQNAYMILEADGITHKLATKDDSLSLSAEILSHTPNIGTLIKGKAINQKGEPISELRVFLAPV